MQREVRATLLLGGLVLDYASSPPSPWEGASFMAIPSSWDVQSRIHTNPTPTPQPTPQLTLDLHTPLSHFLCAFQQIPERKPGRVQITDG